MFDPPPPHGLADFEARGDIAREHVERRLAANIAASEASDRRSGPSIRGLRARVTALLSRIRSKLGAIRGE